MRRTRIIGLMLILVLGCGCGCGCGTESTNTKGSDIGADDKQATLPRNMTEEQLKAELDAIMRQKEVCFEDGLALADAWLSHIDHGEYAASWSESASFLRETISMDEWGEQLETSVLNLGELLQRENISRKSTHNVAVTTDREGMVLPTGRYLVFGYDSSYEHAPAIWEEVFLMDDDGQWRVAAYRVEVRE